jgi:class 3 adenylate cyclase
MILREAVFGDVNARALLLGFGILGAVVLRQIAGFLELLPVTVWPIELVGFFGVVANMGAALAQRYARALVGLDQTNAAIARFVPFKFLALLHRESVRTVCIGDNVKLTMNVMFCDIRGFTTLAEAAGPDATFRQINRYLSMMEPEILKEGGYINQYLGDGIMSLFHTAADNVVAAAVGMIRALEVLNAERGERGEPPLRVGNGINTGPLMLGTIGGREQLDSGVVGDAANLAARVEGMTKIFGATVLLTENTVRALSADAPFSLRELDTVVAQGKRRPVTIYEVIDAEPDAALRAAKMATRSAYARALRAYRYGDFEAAASTLAPLTAAIPTDAPANRLHALAVSRAASRPPAWDGVTVLLGK